MQIFWYLPTHGDGRHLATGIGSREASHAYLKQVAQLQTISAMLVLCCQPVIIAMIPGLLLPR